MRKGNTGTDGPPRYRWKILLGGIVVIGVFIASSPLPGPFDIVVPVVVGTGLGSVIGKSRSRR
ncbi:hypothetical protein AB0I52_06455 [Streptomyces sp. NPDC050423]|uniref:hypothetical protein n=1 Tax=Streptomyces sp. NPDC050423 TaxID=3155402 RepID=UPI00341BB72F